MSANWNHKDEWRLFGKDFMVVVSRHEESELCGDGKHRWCVYAYIYAKHPHFAKFDGPDMWQDAASCLPMHGGPTYLRYHRNDDAAVVSVQVGCDYNHIYDSRFTHYETKDDAYEVFNDAYELFQRLEARIGEATGEPA